MVGCDGGRCFTEAPLMSDIYTETEGGREPAVLSSFPDVEQVCVPWGEGSV